MTGTINQDFRELLLNKFMQDGDIENVYLVFSLNSGRQLADVLNFSESTIESVHEDSSTTEAIYAVRLDVSQRLKYAREAEEGETEDVTIDGLDFVVSDSLLSGNFWTDAYFNAPVPGTSEEFNVVSVVINLDSSANDITSFNNALFNGARVIMQSRPAVKIFNEMEGQFPGLIRF